MNNPHGHSPAFVVLALAVVLASCYDAVEESEAEYSLGNDATASMDFTRALLHYGEAVRLNPDHAEAFLKRGQIRWLSNQFDQSLPDLDRAIEIDSTLTWAYFFRGVSLIQVGRLDNAIPDFSLVIERNEFELEDIVRALTWRSIALFKLGRYDESIADLSVRVALQPQNAVHRIDRGGAYLAVGKTDEAIDDYLFAIQMEGLAEGLRETLEARLASLGVEAPEVVPNDSTSAAIG